MSSNRTQSSRTTSPGSVQSSSDEDDESKEARSRKARDTKTQSRKTKSTERSSSPAPRGAPRRNTENCGGRGSDQRDTTQTKKSTRGNGEERNHQGNGVGRDTTFARGSRDKESAAATVDEVIHHRQKLHEPKFEPRLTFYKRNAMVDGIKRDTAYYYAHRSKVDKVKPVVDNRPPQFFSHIYCNMKKIKIHQDRQDAIDRENRMLLGKLASAMTTTRVDNWNSRVDSSSSNVGKQRQRKQNTRIESENRKMNDRIENRKSTYTSSATTTTTTTTSSSGDRDSHRQQNRSKERSAESCERDVSGRKHGGQPSKTKSINAHHQLLQ